MKTKLSKRLSIVASLVDKDRVIDIGCDHGKLVESLFEEGKITYAFVSDISKPSVLKAVKLLTEHNRNFDYAVADGFSPSTKDKKLNQCIISGMGGLEIIKILSANPTNITSYVLQAQNNVLELKNYLIKNKLTIVRDIIVKDKNIYYNVVKVEKLQKQVKPSLFELRFAYENFLNHNEDFYLYLQYLRQKYENIINNLPLFKKSKLRKELNYVNIAIKKWENMYGKDITISKTR